MMTANAIKIAVLTMSLVICGCTRIRDETPTALTPLIRYSLTLSNDVVVEVLKNKVGVLEVLLLRAGQPIAQLTSDGHEITTFQLLNYASNREGYWSGINVDSEDGRLTTHLFRWFDGKTEQIIVDRDRDFFPDQRVTYDTVAKTKKREAIRHEFTSSEKDKDSDNK